jgi:hypothetical protein
MKLRNIFYQRTSGFFFENFFLLTLSERYEFHGGHYQIFAEHLKSILKDKLKIGDFFVKNFWNFSLVYVVPLKICRQFFWILYFNY